MFDAGGDLRSSRRFFLMTLEQPMIIISPSLTGIALQSSLSFFSPSLLSCDPTLFMFLPPSADDWAPP